MPRRFGKACLLVTAASCGGRTGFFLSSSDEEPFDGGIVVDSGGPPPHDAGNADVPSFVPEEDGAPEVGSSDVVIPPGPASCIQPLGLQPGSPWPIAHRCPARASSAPVAGPTTTPTTAWQARATGAWSSSLVVAASGTLYAADSARGVVALSATGSTLWVTAVPVGAKSPDFEASLAIGADGTIYAWNGAMTALHADGTIAWSIPVSPAPGGSGAASLELTVGNDGTLYVVDAPTRSASEGTLYAIDATGAIRWKKGLGDGLFPASSPAVGASGAVFLVASPVAPDGSFDTSTVEAFTAAGELAWTKSLGPQSLGTAGVVIGDDGDLTSPDGITAEGKVSGRGVGPDVDVVALSASDTFAYAVRTDGAVNGQSADGGGWLYYVGTSPYGSAITDSTGNLYVRFANLPGGPTAALDRDGKELWSASGGAPIAMGADGTIYSLNLNDNPADTITALSP